MNRKQFFMRIFTKNSYVRCTVFILAVLATGCVERSGAEDRGGYAGVFLRLGLGARAKAMGGTSVGYPVDGYSAYYNPAGLGSLRSREALLSYRSLSLDREFQFAGFAAPMPPMAGMALGWIHAGTNDIDGRDFTGRHTQMYSDSQNGFMFGFGLKLSERCNIGVGGTYLRETLVDITATGFGVNLGVLFKPADYLSLGFAARDLGAHYSWNSESLYERGSTTTDNFPAVFTGGACLKISRFDLAVLLDIVKNSKSKTGIRLGAEKSVKDVIDLRAGFDDGDLTAGLGVRFPLLSGMGRFDYALAASDVDPETVHIFSLSIFF